jgi:hypothetical protein
MALMLFRTKEEHEKSATRVARSQPYGTAARSGLCGTVPSCSVG